MWQVREPEKRAFRLLPGLFGGVVAVVLALVLLKASATAGWPAWLRAAVVLATGVVVAAAVQTFLVPRLREKVLRQGHRGEVWTGRLACLHNPREPALPQDVMFSDSCLE